jgi:hypothetical protein
MPNNKYELMPIRGSSFTPASLSQGAFELRAPFRSDVAIVFQSICSLAIQLALHDWSVCMERVSRLREFLTAEIPVQRG